MSKLMEATMFSLSELGPGVGEYFLLDQKEGHVLIAPINYHFMTSEPQYTCCWWTTIDEEVQRMKRFLEIMKLSTIN